MYSTLIEELILRIWFDRFEPVSKYLLSQRKSFLIELVSMGIHRKFPDRRSLNIINNPPYMIVLTTLKSKHFLGYYIKVIIVPADSFSTYNYYHHYFLCFVMKFPWLCPYKDSAIAINWCHTLLNGHLQSIFCCVPLFQVNDKS